MKTQKQFGTFSVSENKKTYGELIINGDESRLIITDKDYFELDKEPEYWISGQLNDLTNISLIECISSEIGSYSKNGERRYSANVFPHYIVSGDCHIAPQERAVSEIHFTIEDATSIFYDRGVFSMYSGKDARSFIEQMENMKPTSKKSVLGESPEIFYFTGKYEIFETPTTLGKITAWHSPTITMPGPKGISVENMIVVTIAFENPVMFCDSTSAMNTLIKYFELLVGRPQNVSDIRISKKSGELKTFLNVYYSMLPKHKRGDGVRNVHPSDILSDPIRTPEDFSKVLRNWLERDNTWRDARFRFFGCFQNQNTYGHDRLIGAANMFDVLPDSAAPPVTLLSQETQNAKDSCREILKKLPVSGERDSVLNALGRWGKSSLKQKIRYRAQQIIDRVGIKFPELLDVVDKAVNCRNHYVHGSPGDLDYNSNVNILAFLTDTLEFVFAASDLIEAGWNIEDWSQAPTTLSHPFGTYRVNYARQLRELKDLLEQNKKSAIPSNAAC